MKFVFVSLPTVNSCLFLGLLNEEPTEEYQDYDK
jgi:hypothetical protein